MPSGLKRWHNFGHDHFVTFTCYHRFPYLNDGHSRTVFEEELEATRKRQGFDAGGPLTLSPLEQAHTPGWPIHALALGA